MALFQACIALGGPMDRFQYLNFDLSCKQSHVTRQRHSICFNSLPTDDHFWQLYSCHSQFSTSRLYIDLVRWDLYYTLYSTVSQAVNDIHKVLFYFLFWALNKVLLGDQWFVFLKLQGLDKRRQVQAFCLFIDRSPLPPLPTVRLLTALSEAPAQRFRHFQDFSERKLGVAWHVISWSTSQGAPWYKVLRSGLKGATLQQILNWWGREGQHIATNCSMGTWAYCDE